jgi:hypothetical protein
VGGFGAGYEAPAIARSLVQSGHFADPFRYATGPTAHLPPLFPAYLALLMKMLGRPEWIVTAAIISAALASAVLIASLPTLSNIFIGRSKPGTYAAYAAILVPFLPLYPNWDANFTAAFVALFAILAYRGLDGSPLRSILLGIFAGLIALLNPAATIAACCTFLFFAVRRGTVLRSLPVFAMTLLLTISPWVFRNWVAFGRLVLIRDNFGMELAASNGDTAPVDSRPNTNAGEAAKARAVGEVSYNEARFKLASAWIKSHPGDFAYRTASRIVDFWFPPFVSEDFHPGSASQVYSVSAWLLTLLAAPGLLLLRQRALIVSMLALCPLLYYVTSTGVRYRTPITWVLLLLAGLSIDWFLQRLRSDAGR